MKKWLVVTVFFIPLTTWGENGIYASFDSGFAKQTNLPTQANVYTTHQLTQPVLRGALGYNHDLYHYPFLGIGFESGMGQYGITKYHDANNTLDVKVQTLEFLLVTTLHCKNNYDIFIKTGGLRIAAYNNEHTVVIGGGKTTFEAGVGAAYKFNRNFMATIMYGYVLGTKAQTFRDIFENPPELNELLLGVRYTFAS